MYIRPSRPDEIYHASHKYFMKIGEGKNARYFYTRNEYEAYKKEKNKLSDVEESVKETERQKRLEGYGLGKKLLKTEKGTRHYSKKWHENVRKYRDDTFLKARKQRFNQARKQYEMEKTIAQSHRLKREQEAADKYGHKAPPGESSAPKKRPRSRKKNVKKVISKIILGSRVGGKKLGGGRNGKS